ncbi:hypothetical protein FE257_010213 [Aspergillus nanangensis]|uniref:ASST-domain-containing protein n=1 Tax=Aspergillus nanangensis TaxID=2582783 RepID=A0AAD4CJ38_ASPNN|nr:hypothetical protein FE257_010213 [Aspergillus nanangensis]
MVTQEDFISFDFNDEVKEEKEAQSESEEEGKSTPTPPLDLNEPDAFDPDYITWSTFHKLLASYPSTVEAVARHKATERATIPKGKKAWREVKAQIAAGAHAQLEEKQLRQVQQEVKEYLELNEWRYQGLPSLLKGRDGDAKLLDGREVARLVEWKMKHGIPRPTLLGMVKSNQEKLIKKTTKDSFARLIDSKEGDIFPRVAMDTLTKPLRGVGPATASLLLSIGCQSVDTPFYSDDVYLWLCWCEYPLPRSYFTDEAEEDLLKMNKQQRRRRMHSIRHNGELNVKYNLQEYEEVWNAVRGFRARLNKDNSSRPEGEEEISCADVEKVARNAKMAISLLLLLLFGAWLPLLASALSWHSLWYEVGFFGAHPTVKYESFELEAPEADVLQWDPRCEDGYILLSPRGHFYPEPGPLIYDTHGNLIWIEKRFGMVMDFKVQHYRGQDYLTFWVGEDDGVRGMGSYYMLDSSYEVVHVVSAANGHQGDVHEFKITEQGTALITIYEICPADLSSLNGPVDGWIYDCLFQEINIETGELLFEWRAQDNYAINETYFTREDGKGSSPSSADAYDYFHINSVDKHPISGNYLVSSRYMHTVTCISPTGDILWILGGKRNMFEDLSPDGSATGFTWQHDARWQSDSEITLLDNGAHEHLRTADHTRGYRIDLDFTTWSASTRHIYDSPGHFSSHSQGNLQTLPASGNVFIGWGKASAYTEFSADGEVLCDTHWGPRAFFWFGWVKSYRAHKTHWVGRPSHPPDVAVDETTRSVYVSWNGATDVAGWLLQRATNRSSHEGEDVLETINYVPKHGFETMLDVTAADRYLRLVAVGYDGLEMGYSEVFAMSQVASDLQPIFEGDMQHVLIAALKASVEVVVAGGVFVLVGFAAAVFVIEEEEYSREFASAALQ